DPSMRPAHEQAARRWLHRKFGAYTVSGMEADDAIGLEMDADSICVSLDKDLDTLSGRHYNWVRDEFYTVTPAQARTNFYCQLLTGDKADNVEGIAGIGPVNAHRLLDDLPEAGQRSAVKTLYRESGLDFELNYYLLKILENEDELHAAFEYAKARAGITPVPATPLPVRNK
ncbi:MAG: hypothetical protein ACYDB1_01300, partial [Acidiferrobacteraceae bacterium]